MSKEHTHWKTWWKKQDHADSEKLTSIYIIIADYIKTLSNKFKLLIY